MRSPAKYARSWADASSITGSPAPSGVGLPAAGVVELHRGQRLAVADEQQLADRRGQGGGARVLMR